MKMKYFCIFLLLFICKPVLITCQNQLTIEIDHLRNNKGKIHFVLMDTNEKIIQELSSNIIGTNCIIKIENLKSGKYAFKYFHDENNNKKIDTNWIGIPKDGYGFSNTTEGKFGPPSFKKMVFELTTDKTVRCTPTYITF